MLSAGRSGTGDRPLTLYRRFSHLGVYKEKDVLATQRKGRVTALRFSDTEVFSRPVSLVDLRDLATRCGHTLVLRSVQCLPAHLFDAIYRQGRP